MIEHIVELRAKFQPDSLGELSVLCDYHVEVLVPRPDETIPPQIAGAAECREAEQPYVWSRLRERHRNRHFSSTGIEVRPLCCSGGIAVNARRKDIERETTLKHHDTRPRPSLKGSSN